MTGTEIKERRQDMGWTQVDLAVASRLSPATIYRAERGDRVTAANLAAIESAFSHEEHGNPARGPVKQPDGPATPKQRAVANTQGA